jgi:hypothetical protein
MGFRRSPYVVRDGPCRVSAITKGGVFGSIRLDDLRRRVQEIFYAMRKKILTGCRRDT